MSGTKLAHLRKKECWPAYLQCLLESQIVRASAEAVQVHRTTSFRWRHRMVAGFTCDRPARLGGMVEADETYMLESQKGLRRLNRPPRHRGGMASHRGIGRDHECLLVACARAARPAAWRGSRGLLRAADSGAGLEMLRTDDGMWRLHFVDAGGALAVIVQLDPEAAGAAGVLAARPAIQVRDGRGGLVLEGSLDADGECEGPWPFADSPAAHFQQHGARFEVIPRATPIT
ncbi:hypothetical protein [Telluria beijingensis]|uniref:hypothetical protein n=1 Tax=Telluria beijingensis TaxID=3068633 RepID=UPI002795B0A0|nr:hypothetical protein [Massilia sp. REN29]